MLSYRHSFHAGNHADVLKHTVQSLIIESLKEKDKPFLYLDTHAGAGRYLLSGEHAERTGEYLEGIARIWQRDDLPAELEPYISAVSHFNRSGQLRYYPGSPLIARQLLRPQDSLQLTELHPSDFPLLRGEFQKDERARVERADGYQQLKSKLPPASRRGLILIDPPYEIKTDYQAVVQGINEGYKRFATGVYALWYPVVLRNQIKRMMNDLESTGIRRILQIELAVRPDSDQRGMTASGMIVINPPWKLEQQMATLLPWLHKALVPAGTGHTTLKWVVPE
ncbi:23S rRNA (adenine(2030)-N(6))-methyltransferase RlmJ [Cronobacter turicensis]|jgi:23S rRNA (adenine2030-N6)-methyltransferase|uniref:23S rRNA (adenine(2030)-N(6))-methyltransferase RlmJ n=1 Tax=Cronobacter turicensis TaxID=413502 RepID=UPI001375716D|nr:23S rRNA (adenine(2030)-N(6))-methyltransferase RlmJ [Cronobacter turicensis]EKM0371688.1 23S rRNA (adenine(2030)-N(6))-methyltransferase RlmJ [Cronobacter turicensis]EKM0375196.1 23S rRNA (adenine(2030)-N(6))-methyltransferase RlmJ [Cronobacter turicensis]ELQ6107306.1 23S rRNA (adenine(2030)-N(6))-methyltransferase RlmJ [Cronobacter turicensis]NCH64344.1 23S rRNA (adenine(2030)-N(6))-methyltransferase RlmJ [Cronobacter turicensis]HDI3034924.1 23S rRNA (adenine(2030)-N(6))-methyltransferase